jgi:hypothetical protein
MNETPGTSLTVLVASLSAIFGVIADIEVVRDTAFGLAVGAVLGNPSSTATTASTGAL